MRPSFPHRGLNARVFLLIGSVLTAALALGYFVYQRVGIPNARTANLWAYLRDPDSHADWVMEAGTTCGEAPFQMPTRGYIGFIWGDSFRIGHSHQGLDIFGGTDINVTPVYAAYRGYLTREEDWKSSVIVRVPSDPLQPDRQIWLYYTHMADPQGNSFIAPKFPPGTYEAPVEAGTLLGYQGNYSGDPLNPTGVHLHFSVVLDDGSGKWLNELEKENTVDPSAYLGMALNAETNREGIPACGIID